MGYGTSETRRLASCVELEAYFDQLTRQRTAKRLYLTQAGDVEAAIDEDALPGDESRLIRA